MGWIKKIKPAPPPHRCHPPNPCLIGDYFKADEPQVGSIWECDHCHQQWYLWNVRNIWPYVTLRWRKYPRWCDRQKPSVSG